MNSDRYAVNKGKRTLPLLTGLLLAACGGGTDIGLEDPNLAWQDEFSTPGAPDPARWAYDIGNGVNGWGNQELQTYTSNTENAFVDAAGFLHIVAKPDGTGGYTSARLKTQGKMPASQPTYGFVEVRAKLPCEKGAWPAIWMLHDPATWPVSGEIDIVEWFGKSSPPTRVDATVHFGPTGTIVSGSATVDSVCNTFHRYQLNWTPDKIEISVDDQPPHVTCSKLTNCGQSLWPFDQDFHFLLNIAVGGTQGGSTIENLPYEMLVDYVRVYKVQP